MPHDPVMFYAKYQDEDVTEFNSCVEALSIVGEPFGLDYETVYSFAHSIWGRFKNYQTGSSLLKQAMRYCLFLVDLPDTFVRPSLNLYTLCEMFGFDVARPIPTTNRALLSEALIEVNGTLRLLRGQIDSLYTELNPPIPVN